MQVPDPFLTYSVLKMRIHSAESNGLTLDVQVLKEACIGEVPIVSVVVIGHHSMLGAVVLPSVLGFQVLRLCQVGLHVHPAEPAVVVGEDGAGGVPGACEESLELRHKSWCVAFHLVHG